MGSKVHHLMVRVLVDNKHVLSVCTDTSEILITVVVVKWNRFLVRQRRLDALLLGNASSDGLSIPAAPLGWTMSRDVGIIFFHVWIWSDSHDCLPDHSLWTGFLHRWIEEDGAFVWLGKRDDVCSKLLTTMVNTSTSSPAAVRESLSFNEPPAGVCKLWGAFMQEILQLMSIEGALWRHCLPYPRFCPSASKRRPM